MTNDLDLAFYLLGIENHISNHYKNQFITSAPTFVKEASDIRDRSEEYYSCDIKGNAHTFSITILIDSDLNSDVDYDKLNEPKVKDDNDAIELLNLILDIVDDHNSSLN